MPRKEAPAAIRYMLATHHTWALGLAPPSRQHTLLAQNTTEPAPVVQERRAEDRPNILYVLTDDHGYTDLGRNVDSNVVTPWLVQLRTNGANFQNGYSTAPQCVPSRAGVMSGRNQNTFGLWANTVDAGFGSNTLPPRPLVTTIAEHVKELGYSTGMSGKWHLGNLEDPKTNPGGRGFDWYFTGMVNQFYTNVNQADGSLLPSMTHVADRRNRIDVTGEMVERFVDRHVLSNWFFYCIQLILNPRPVQDGDESAAHSSESCRGAGAPYGPHHPMLEDGDHFLEAFRKMDNFKPYPFYSAEENDARLRGLALVHAIDTRMGNIVQNLRRHKIEQNTLILFASDNGAPMGMSYVEGQTRFRRDIWREVQPSPLPSPGLPAGGDYLPFVRDPSSSYVGSENVPLRGGKGTTWQGGIKCMAAL